MSLLKPYTNPTRRIFGNGSFKELPDVLASLAPKNILVVLGENSFRKSPYFSLLEAMLEPFRYFYASPVSQNPHHFFIQEEILRLKEKSYDLVLGIGGGSVLDVSKLFAAIPFQKEMSVEKYLQPGFPLLSAPVPVIAVPTTSGTGSEVTPYASLETSEKKKITITHPSFYPTVAIIDPELTYTMPEYVTACTGFDALSQAIESFWAVSATPFSQTHALRALDLILSSLYTACTKPLDSKSRFSMALGSCEAGLAIAYTKTTAVHSVSYPITAHFGIAHGHACALTLASFLRFNAAVLRDSGMPMLKVFGCSDYELAAEKVESLMQEIKLERSLSKLGIDEKGRELILREGFRPDRVLNNPRKLEVGELKKILASIA